ncbi:hypothetical protein MHT86_08050 [Corynebacterium mastitidis]|uniref:Tail assembly chaperone n=1 Tax=Corynebacterium mastitidis TaxID=161890 RepID=A0A2N0X8W1_9CORY|nr:hypothetical protein [Corynebacterium mastitidis]MCH6197445.1 hypothetical protein [Corynebacterium mastitidis]PKF69151.1 hypothetical protein CXB45_03125 [Corynebacterium mastitidis]
MSENLNELLKQRAEATGVAGNRATFEFGTETFSFLDPVLMDDEEKEELAELTHDVDIAEFYMGEDEYERFVSTTATIELDNGETIEVTGSSSIFFLAFREHLKGLTDEDPAGNPTRPNRSSRRAAVRKRQKRR